MNILLIDDDYYFFKRLRPELLAYNIECIHQNNFNFIKCYDHLRSSDAILLDYHLHPRDGLEIADEIRRYYPQLAVFIVSAESAGSVQSKSIAGWIEKTTGVKHIATQLLAELKHRR